MQAGVESEFFPSSMKKWCNLIRYARYSVKKTWVSCANCFICIFESDSISLFRRKISCYWLSAVGKIYFYLHFSLSSILISVYLMWEKSIKLYDTYVYIYGKFESEAKNSSRLSSQVFLGISLHRLIVYLGSAKLSHARRRTSTPARTFSEVTYQVVAGWEIETE